MLKLYVKVQNLLKSQKGQGMVEYAMIIGLVAVGVLALLALMGDYVGDIFTAITNALDAIPGVGN
ncbi:MAG TPA: Flp family type IVb pilin [Symbiobacteriaceae bacterium]|jgi:pilus assembly protein Flp/PilA|nr:Flp family type IVb pilin [Symbiobacteriaceae bacterium]